jgi:hypothetical protein
MAYDDSNNRNPKPASTGFGIGCLAALLVAVAIPLTVFCAILIGNSRNPQCGTPADAGGCEMGLASGTITAVVLGLIVGLVVLVVAVVVSRMKRKPE